MVIFATSSPVYISQSWKSTKVWFLALAPRGDLHRRSLVLNLSPWRQFFPLWCVKIVFSVLFSYLDNADTFEESSQFHVFFALNEGDSQMSPRRTECQLEGVQFSVVVTICGENNTIEPLHNQLEWCIWCDLSLGNARRTIENSMCQSCPDIYPVLVQSYLVR